MTEYLWVWTYPEIPQGPFDTAFPPPLGRMVRRPPPVEHTKPGVQSGQSRGQMPLRKQVFQKRFSLGNRLTSKAPTMRTTLDSRTSGFPQPVRHLPASGHSSDCSRL